MTVKVVVWWKVWTGIDYGETPPCAMPLKEVTIRRGVVLRTVKDAAVWRNLGFEGLRIKGAAVDGPINILHPCFRHCLL